MLGATANCCGISSEALYGNNSQSGCFYFDGREFGLLTTICPLEPLDLVM